MNIQTQIKQGVLGRPNGNDQMHNDNTNEFATSDLYFAAFLQTVGAPMRHERRSGKVSFIFDTSVVNIAELTQAWYSQSGKVPALPYANNIKNLKAICHMP